MIHSAFDAEDTYTSDGRAKGSTLQAELKMSGTDGTLSKAAKWKEPPIFGIVFSLGFVNLKRKHDKKTRV